MKTLAKTIIWRCLSFTIALCSARIWFGDWHISHFTIFLTFLLMGIYYVFELIWERRVR